MLVVLLADVHAFLGKNRVLKQFTAPHKNINVPDNNRHIQQRDRSVVVASSTTAALNIASLKAISKLLATCGIGVYSAKTGVLNKQALSVSSSLVYNIFQPCLLFCNVATTVSKLGKGGSVYLLPLAAIAQIFLGFMLGKVMGLALYGSKNSPEKKQFQMCTTFGNSGPLPLVFVDALLKSHANAAYLPQSVGFISLYLLGWSPLFWILGPTILAPDDGSGKKQDFKALLKKVLSPPVLGSLAGCVFGAIPFLANILVKPTGLFYPLFAGMSTLGAGYLPSVLLVLAGSLAPQPDENAAENQQTAAEANEEKKNFFKQVASIYLARFLVMPVVGFGLISAAKKSGGMIASLLSDPILVLVLLLETCMPSAQNSTVILQLLGDRKGAAQIARVLMAVYTLGIPAMTFWIARVLKVAGLTL